MNFLFKKLCFLLVVCVSCLSMPLMAAINFLDYFASPAAWGESMTSLQGKCNNVFRNSFQSGRDTTKGRGAVSLLTNRNEGIVCIAPGKNFNFGGEDIFDFEVRYSRKGLPTRGIFSLYNRGDCPPLSETDFNNKVKKIEGLINKSTGKKARKRSGDNVALNVKRTFYIWETKAVSYILDVSVTPAKGNEPLKTEYIKVTVTSPKNVDTFIDSYIKKPRRITKKDLKRNVQRDKNGDVYLPKIPMVHQGAKGYCAAATAARVLQYYGRNMAMHDVAQVSKSDATKGTSPVALIQSLNQVDREMDISIRTVNEFMIVSTLQDYINRYNETAKRMKKPTLNMTARGGNVSDYLDKMDKDVRKASRNTADLQKIFKRTVYSAIDMGVPVVWSLTLGLAPEEGSTPQQNGGHMRLIIGYNKKTNTIIFSDTWGQGHEKKKIKLEDAIFATTGLHIIYPQYDTSALGVK